MSGKDISVKKMHPSRGKDISSMKKPEQDSEVKTQLKLLKSRKRSNIALMHLDRAEKLALDLLKLCADTCDKLSELTQIDDGRTLKDSSPVAAEILVLEKEKQIIENGNEFRTKTQEIYDLMAPHIKQVQNYSRRTTGTQKHQSEEAVEDDDETTPVTEHNIYSSRLELRLARDHCEILKRMLALEKKQRNEASMTDAKDESMNEGFEKRKR